MTCNYRRSLAVFATALAVLFSATLDSKAQSLPDSDFQIWGETSLIFPIVKTKDAAGKENDKLSLIVLGALRLGQNRLFPIDARVGAGFDLKLNKYWSFSPTYVYRRGEPIRDRKNFEHRLRFDLTVGQKWKRFSLKDRNRIEYRIRHSNEDSVRYRNKVTFAFPVMKDNSELFSPFVSEEVFYDITAKEFSSNEVTAGITRKLSKNTAADFFWLRRDLSSGQIRHFNAIGVNLKIRID